MTIYSYKDNALEKVNVTKFCDEGILERAHLQNALKKNIGIVAPDVLVAHCSVRRIIVTQE